MATTSTTNPSQVLPKPGDPPAIALSGNNAQRTLWIGDVPLDWTEEKIAEIFTEAGHPPYKVKRVELKGERQGYCFIEYTSNPEARNALYNLNGNRIPGVKGKHRFNLCFSNDSYNPNSEFNLHVSNLPTDLTDAELYRIFDKYISCRGAKMFRFADGTTKGCGFVRFGDQTDQQMALVEMHRTKVHSMRIQLRLAGPRGERADRANKFQADGRRKEDNGRSSFSSYAPGQPAINSYGAPTTNLKETNLYSADNPWAPTPDDHEIDPVIGLDLLTARYRPNVTNKRYMIQSEQFMYDLESSRYGNAIYSFREKEEDLVKKLDTHRWKLIK
ncbi:unnamed protein product [Caenorhabditis bovis]|uniref:RRM domain-containing protein n=1 Tax=Caenorhabditis bovis TaxID=2654633 RepID=A0A8S1EBX1_9PELO|nr:unnamed protein product [Caenorhabditis bovis]